MADDFAVMPMVLFYKGIRFVKIYWYYFKHSFIFCPARRSQTTSRAGPEVMQLNQLLPVMCCSRLFTASLKARRQSMRYFARM